MMTRLSTVSILSVCGLLFLLFALSGCQTLCPKKAEYHAPAPGKTEFKLIEVGYAERFNLDISTAIEEIEAMNGEVVSISVGGYKKIPDQLERMYIVVTYRTAPKSN